MQAKPEKGEAHTDIVNEGQTGHRAYILQNSATAKIDSIPLLKSPTFSVIGVLAPLRTPSANQCRWVAWNPRKTALR